MYLHQTKSHCVIMCYDITDKKSFEFLKETYGKELELYRNEKPDCVFVLVGTKLDLQTTKREVSREEGQKYAKEHGFRFMEVSSQTGENVKELFYITVDVMLQKIVNREVGEEYYLKPKP